MKKTKIVALLLAFCAFGSLAACGDKGEDSAAKQEEATHNEFIEEIGGVSETYEGGVSAVSYPTAEEAAEAYVEQEVIGLSKTATIESTVSKGELTQAQVTALKLPEEISEGIQSVEEIEVEYSEVEASVGYTDTLNKTKKIKVYIIKYSNDEFKYYTPAPITGETISKNYYDSVFDSSKYTNCTYSIKLDMAIDYSISYNGNSYSMSEEMIVEQYIKYADGKIYMEQTIIDKSSATGEGSYNNTDKIYAYIEEVEVDGYKEIVCYVKMDDSTEWNPTELYTIGFSSLDELMPFHDQYLDYSYFTKTDYGFELGGDNAEQYLNEAMGSAGVSDILNSTNMEFLAKYYVKNGALSGMRMDYTVSMNQSGVSMSVVSTGLGTVKDYGTTVVEKPFTEEE